MGENDFKVELGISYDKEKITELQNSIKNLSSKDNIINIKTKYDFTKLNKDLDDLQSKVKSLSNVKISISTDYTDGNISSSVSRGSSSKKRKTTVKYAETSDIQNAKNQVVQLKQYLDNINKSMQNTKGISSASKGFNKLNNDITTTISKLEVIQKKLSSGNNIESSSLKSMLTQLDNIEVKANSTQSKITSLKKDVVKEIEDNLESSFLDSTLSNFEKKINTLQSNKSKSKINNSISEAYETLKNLNLAKNNKDEEKMLVLYSKLTNLIEGISSSYKLANKEQKAFSNTANLETKRITLLNKVKQLLNSNSAATRKYKTELNSIFDSLSSGKDIDIPSVDNRLKEITSEIKAMDISTTNFFTRLKTQFQKLSTYITATTVINKTSQALRTMYNNVLEIDTAMTNLYRVTDLTTSQYESLYSNMTKTAKEYGSTLVDVINSTSEWAKLGFDTNTANELAGITTMYQNITDIDTETAVNDLVTAYKGFQDQLNGLYSGNQAKAVEYIADIYNLLGNKYAVSAQDVGSALSRSASSLSMAGNSIQESAAMATGITEVIQDAEKAGTALKTLSLRLRGTTVKELENMGEETDGVVETTSKLRENILSLTNQKVDIQIDENTYKTPYKIMSELAKIYQDLTDSQQAGLLETIAGKSHSNSVAALLQNWEQVENAMTDATNAEGSARTENEIYMQSLNAKIKVMKANLQSLSGKILNSDSLSDFLSFINNILEGTDKLISKFGFLSIATTTFATVLSLKGGFKNTNFITSTLSTLKELEIHLSSLKTSNLKDLISYGFSDTKNPLKAMSKTQQLGIDVSAIKKRNSLIESGYKEDSLEVINAMSNASAEAKQLSKDAGNTSVKMETLAKYTNSTVPALNAAEAGAIALNIAINMLATAAITAAIYGIDKMIHYSDDLAKKSQEAANKSRETAEACTEESNSLNELISKYKELASSENQNENTRSEILSVQNQINNLVGIQAEGIDLVNGKLDEELAKLYEIQNVKLGEDTSSYERAVKDAKEETKDVDLKDGNFAYDFSMRNHKNSITVDTGKVDREYVQIIDEALRDKGYGSASTEFGAWGDAFYELYLNSDLTVKEKIDALDTAIKALETSGKDYNNSDLWSKLGEYRKELDTAYEKEFTAVNALLNNLSTKSIGQGKDVSNYDEFNKYKQEIISEILDNETIKDEIKDNVIDDKYVEEYVDGKLKTFEKYTNYYSRMQQQITAENNLNIDKIKSNYLNKLKKDALEITEKEFNTLAKEYVSSGGNPSNLSKAKFGNIDLHDRNSITWNDKNISKYRQELQSWGLDVKDVKGDISTVLGNTASYDGIDITFSPILQTENGAELLSSNTLDTYISSLVEKASADGSWTNEELFMLDAEGLEINGKRIQNMIADIGNTAIATSKIMHYLGTDGALALYQNTDALNLFTDEAIEFDFWLNSLPKEDLEWIYRISLDTESAKYSLEEWQRQLEYARNGKYINEDSVSNFYNVFKNTEDGSFSATLEDYQSQLSTFQDIITKYNSGELSDSDINDLIRQYPTLIEYTDDLDKGVNQLIDSSKSKILESFNEQIEKLGKDSDGGKMMAQLRDRIIEVTDAAKDGVILNIDSETTFLENIGKALNESVSGSGISSSTVKSITNMFKDVEGFDASELFEKTSYGIHLNINALQDLQDEYIKTKKADLQDQLDEKVDKYNKLTNQINKTSDAIERANLVSEQNTLRKEIDEVAALIVEYDGLTSAYNNWLRAKETDNEGSIYDTIRSGVKETEELYKNDLIGTDDFQEYVQLVSNQDLSNATAGEYGDAWNKVKSKVKRYSSEDSTGVTNLLKDIRAIDKSLANIDSKGNWRINFDDDSISMLADKLGISEEYIESIIYKSQDFGMDLDLSGLTEELKLSQNELDKCVSKLKELNLTEFTFDFTSTNLEDLDSQIEEAKNIYRNSDFWNADGTLNINVEGAEEAQTILKNLIQQRQQIANSNITLMKIDTSKLTGKSKAVVTTLQNIKKHYDKIELNKTLNIDTSESEKKLIDSINQIQNNFPELITTLGIDTTSVDTVLYSIKNITPEILASAGIDVSLINETLSEIEETDNTVIYDVNKTEVDKFKNINHDITATIRYNVNSSQADIYENNNKTITRTIMYKNKSGSKVTINDAGGKGSMTVTNKNGSVTSYTEADGTAHASGTAYAQGSWGTKDSGIALGGELGQELVVYFMPPYMVTYK